MKKLFFLSMAAIAIFFAGCNENEPDAAPGDNSYTTNNTNNNNAPSVVNGQLSGAFSVSATEKVHFSQGNLQYNAAQNTWRFAENQYDTIGKVANQQIASDYDGYIDLFGWAPVVTTTKTHGSPVVILPSMAMVRIVCPIRIMTGERIMPSLTEAI